MTKRQPSWNMLEAIVLLDAFITTKDGSLSRTDAIKHVSSDLRKMALNQGTEIDQTFRNENGISFQMHSMESAFLGRTMLKPATKLFAEAVRIYREDHSEYQKLLKEAKTMIESKKTIIDDFMQYLAEKVSPSQLSELYTCYSEIEAFCMKVRVLHKPLFETTDFETIKKVQCTVEQNKFFRVTHKRQLNKMLTACRYYYSYIKDRQFLQAGQELRAEEITRSKTPEGVLQTAGDNDCAKEHQLTRTEQDERLLQKYPIIYKRVYSSLKAANCSLSIGILGEKINRIARSSVLEEILDNVSWAKSVGDKYSFSDEIVNHHIVINEVDVERIEKGTIDNDLCVIDFEKDFDLSFSKPESFTYFGEKKTCGSTWTDLYVAVFAVIYDDYPHLLRPGMSFSKTKTRVELAVNTNYDFMFDPKPVPGTDLMLETNISANNIAAKIKYILELCCVDFENVVISYRKRHATTTACTESVNKAPSTSSSSHRTETVLPYRKNEYEAVLSHYFQKGFRMESPLEIKKFRRYYSSIHEKEISDSDDKITSNIKALSILYDGKAFLPDIMLGDEIKTKLFAYIDSIFSEGKAAIYYQALYTEFAEDFLDHHIHNADMLKAYLIATANGRFYTQRSFISKESNVEIDPLSEIRNCLIEYGRPLEYEELFEALAHIPQSKIKSILASNSEFVSNGPGTYFHEQIVRLSDDEKEGIAEIINQTITDKDFMGGNELYDAIKTKYSYIIEENNFLSVCGFRDVLKVKLGNRFSFRGNIISHSNNELSMADVFAKYAQTHESFTLTELQSLASNLATSIYFEAVYENSLRISKEHFVSKAMAQFAVPETDDVLDRVCVGKYIPIREVQNFGIFPYGGFTWNSYLLEHYVANYSHKYKLLHSGFNGTECTGAIVRRSAGIDSFDDLIIDILVNNPIELMKAPALQYLSDKGYLARRRYSEIESLIIKAKAQKQRKDD